MEVVPLLADIVGCISQETSAEEIKHDDPRVLAVFPSAILDHNTLYLVHLTKLLELVLDLDVTADLIEIRWDTTRPGFRSVLRDNLHGLVQELLLEVRPGAIEDALPDGDAVNRVGILIQVLRCKRPWLGVVRTGLGILLFLNNRDEGLVRVREVLLLFAVGRLLDLAEAVQERVWRFPQSRNIEVLDLLHIFLLLVASKAIRQRGLAGEDRLVGIAIGSTPLVRRANRAEHRRRARCAKGCTIDRRSYACSTALPRATESAACSSAEAALRRSHLLALTAKAKVLIDALALGVPLNLDIVLEERVEVALGLLESILDQGQGRLRVEVRDVAIDIGVEVCKGRSGGAHAGLRAELV